MPCGLNHTAGRRICRARVAHATDARRAAVAEGLERRTLLSFTSIVTVQQGEPSSVRSLWDAFDDPNTADETLTFSVVGNTNPGLFSGTPISDDTGTLTLNYTPGQNGQATLTLRATDPSGLSVDTAFTVTVTPA